MKYFLTRQKCWDRPDAKLSIRRWKNTPKHVPNHVNSEPLLIIWPPTPVTFIRAVIWSLR